MSCGAAERTVPGRRDGLTPSRFTASWLVTIAILAASSLWMWLLSGGGRAVMFDSFRDMAWANNVAGGRLWSDPVLAGEAFWYAPGNPFVFGALSRITGAEVADIYRTSACWWNAFIPLALFAVAARVGGRVAGILALPLVLLGSLWWLTHVAAPMPSIQSTLLGLLALLCWHRCALSIGSEEQGHNRRADSLATLAGVIIAATAWFHPVCAVVAAAAIALHGLFGIVLPASLCRGTAAGPKLVRSRVARALLRVAVPAVLLSAPLAVHLAIMPKVNRVPLEYYARELSNPDFAIQAHTILLPILGIVGAIRLFRQRPGALWSVGYVVAGTIGQAAGYLHHWARLPVPYLLPHEFQWHTQLGLGITAAFAIVDIAEWLSTRVPWPSESGLRKVLWVGLMAVAVLTPAFSYVPAARSYQVEVAEIESANSETIGWIRRNTSLSSVFASDPLYAHLVVAGLTGRKCVAVPIGHMNPAVDGLRRLDDLATMLSTEDEAVFADLAARYGVTHFVLKQVTPGAAAHARRVSDFSCLRARHVSIPEGVTIYEVHR